MKRSIKYIGILFFTALLFGCASIYTQEPLTDSSAEKPQAFTIKPTVFLVEERGQLFQLVELQVTSGIFGDFSIVAEQTGKSLESKIQIEEGTTSCSFLVPACGCESCPIEITIKDDSGAMIQKLIFNIPYQRRWKVFLSPFSHIDVGFTNCQRKILAQNIENIRVAIDLIEETRDYPEHSRFKFFTEVSWPLYEFLYSDATTSSEKELMRDALHSGKIEAGGFLISHQNKFMPAEALFRSTDWALEISREFDVPVKTGCLDDLMDLSSIVKPLYSAGIPYFIGGPNTTRYIAPPLFYLQPPIGEEKVLVWLTPNLNGYGENFDFAMRPGLPITDKAISEIESRLGSYLKSLETDGAPPTSVRRHFDFYGATWSYPYDIYFLPFYPAHAVDNGPQDITPPEIVRAWNMRWAWPKLVIANPSEFFSEVERRYSEDIPTIRGDLPGFWGEQVYLALAQVDPGKECIQREFERNASCYEMASTLALLKGEKHKDLLDEIALAYKLITLNNDHNPGPVSFGHTSYTKEDVAEWKDTRRGWIAEISKIGSIAKSEAQSIATGDKLNSSRQEGCPSATDQGNAILLENKFYRVELDKKTGGITSLFDKELDKELVSRDGEYLLNQYVVVARGENAGVRGNLFVRPGFREVEVEIKFAGPERATVLVTGRTARNSDSVRVLSTFIKQASNKKVPGFLIRLVAPFIGMKLGPVDEVSQEIELRAGEKAVYFTQRFCVDHDQLIDHTFAYPLNVPKDRPLIIEGPYNSYRFSPGQPFDNGDLIPGARMTDVDFPSINDMIKPFEWMYGMPADAVFRSCVLAVGDGFGIAFSSKDSGVILPGPVDMDPVQGTFGGGFYHVAVGCTFYGNLFLGAPREEEFIFRSALTSFPANDLPEAKVRAARFGYEYCMGDPFIYASSLSSNPDILITSLRAISAETILLRLYDASGRGGKTTITLPGERAIASAFRARSDGLPQKTGGLPVKVNAFKITLGPGEVVTVRVDLM